MSDAIVIRTNNRSIVSDTEIAAFAKRLKLMIVNGKNLSDSEAMALAQYSYTTGLNPFASECYYLPGIGPGPGIAGWRVKAEEQLEYEAMKAHIPTARYWCEYLDPDPGEGKFGETDIAVKAVLHDTITKSEWEKRVLGHYIELVKNGIKDGAYDLARELVGPEPVWTAIGVVRATESFGAAEKMDRYERACKRAEKAAIRKRFPRVNLPEPSGFDEEIIEGQLQEAPPRIESEILSELGFDPIPDNEPPAPPLELTPPPTPDARRAKLLRRFDELNEQAEAVGLSAVVVPIDISDEDLIMKGTELRERIRLFEKAQGLG